MNIRQLDSSEFEIFKQIDRREVVEQKYYFRNGGLELVDEYIDVPEWTDKKKEQFISEFKELSSQGGMVFGAFEGSHLAGMAVLDTRFMGQNMDQLNLNGLWVSRDFRKKGVASGLIDHVKKIATELGAKSLYVSATESYNTVNFYMHRGFKLAKKVDKRLYAKEPMDIHMVMDI